MKDVVRFVKLGVVGSCGIVGTSIKRLYLPSFVEIFH